jgi:hypothetical protein
MAAVAADPSKTTVGPAAASGAGALHSGSGSASFDLKKYLVEKKDMVEQALDASLQVRVRLRLRDVVRRGVCDGVCPWAWRLMDATARVDRRPKPQTPTQPNPQNPKP